MVVGVVVAGSSPSRRSLCNYDSMFRRGSLSDILTFAFSSHQRSDAQSCLPLFIGKHFLNPTMGGTLREII